MKLREENGRIIIEPVRVSEKNYLKDLIAAGVQVTISRDVPQASGSPPLNPSSAKDS